MPDVPNPKVITRYKDLLANRTHEVIVMNLAIEMLEQQVLDLESDKKILTEEVSNLKQSVDRATDLVKRLKTKEEDEE